MSPPDNGAGTVPCHDARQLSPRREPDSRSPQLRNKRESRFLRLGELQRDEGEEKTRG